MSRLTKKEKKITSRLTKKQEKRMNRLDFLEDEIDFSISLKKELAILSDINLDVKILMNPRPVMGAIREFFGSSPLSQYMDQTNPLAELTHKRRLSALGPGGLNKDRAGLDVREIHPSHYGRICPIETPEGKNAGLVNSLTTYSRRNPAGFLECPLYKVETGKVLFEQGPYYLSSEQEEKIVVAPPDLLISSNSELSSTKTIPVRYGKEFFESKCNKVDFIGTSPIQMISIATSLIPFLEHDDANRVLMGSNMQRQAVPVLQSEKPFVGTGLESQIARDSGTVLLSETTGFVISVSSARISVRSKNKYVEYFLKDYYRSNQKTWIYQKPLVRKGDWVLKGDLLADGSNTLLGELALGRNILVAYMPWEGYNFEDAVLISERLVKENIYTSVHITRYEVEAKTTLLGDETFTNQIKTLDASLIKNLDERGLIKVGTWVQEGDILVGKITPYQPEEPSPEMRLLLAIFQRKLANFRETCLRVPDGLQARVLDICLSTKEKTVRVFLAEKRKIQIGDKIAGRHGNKGIVSTILPEQDMPFSQDGTSVDLVLNALGIPSRMNVGQVFECLLGLAGKYLHQNYKLSAFDEMYGQEASRGLVYHKLYEAKKKTGENWLFERNFAGKSRLFDGRTGEVFDQPILIGYPYMLKLIHLVDDKMHSRSTGPYSLVTQQPLGGRAKHGGQRLGEMEVWALEGFGASYTLQELLTFKSDETEGRRKIFDAIIKKLPIPTEPGLPESFYVLMSELKALCIGVDILKFDSFPDYSQKNYNQNYKKQLQKNSSKLKKVLRLEHIIKSRFSLNEKNK
jgi:DNA-directed RNA polymerase subunit beta